MTTYLKKYPQIDGLDGVRAVTLMRQIADSLDGTPTITIKLELDQLRFVARWWDINFRYTYMVDVSDWRGEELFLMQHALQEFISKANKGYIEHVAREKNRIMQELRRLLEEHHIVPNVYHISSTQLNEIQISCRQSLSVERPYNLTVKYEFSYLYQQKNNLDSVVQELLKKLNDI